MLMWLHGTTRNFQFICSKLYVHKSKKAQETDRIFKKSDEKYSSIEIFETIMIQELVWEVNCKGYV